MEEAPTTMVAPSENRPHAERADYTALAEREDCNGDWPSAKGHNGEGRVEGNGDNGEREPTTNGDIGLQRLVGNDVAS